MILYGTGGIWKHLLQVLDLITPPPTLRGLPPQLFLNAFLHVPFGLIENHDVQILPLILSNNAATKPALAQ